MHTASEEDAERLVSLLYNLTKCVRISQIPLDSPAADAGDPSSSLPHPPLQVLQLATPCGCLLQVCSRHVPPSRHLVLVQCSGLPWGTPLTHRLAEKNSTGRGGEWQHSLWWLWFSVVNHTPPHPSPHPFSGHLFTHHMQTMDHLCVTS